MNGCKNLCISVALLLLHTHIISNSEYVVAFVCSILNGKNKIFNRNSERREIDQHTHIQCSRRHLEVGAREVDIFSMRVFPSEVLQIPIYFSHHLIISHFNCEMQKNNNNKKKPFQPHHAPPLHISRITICCRFFFLLFFCFFHFDRISSEFLNDGFSSDTLCASLSFTHSYCARCLSFYGRRSHIILSLEMQMIFSPTHNYV